MRPDDILEYTRRRPFQPFRITLTDGRSYDVHHPEMAIVGRSFVAVGLPKQGGSEVIADRLVHVSLLHIMQAELIGTAAPPANGEM